MEFIVDGPASSGDTPGPVLGPDVAQNPSSIRRVRGANLSESRRLRLVESACGVLSEPRWIQAEPFSLEDLFHEFISALLNGSELCWGAVFVLDAGDQIALSGHGGTLGEVSVEALRAFSGASPFLRHVIRGGKPMFVSTDKNPGTVQRLLEQTQARSMIVAPLLSGKDALGVLVLASRENDLDSEWLSIVGLLGVQVGQALALSQAMKKVAVAEGRYQTLLDQANDGVVLLDLHARIVEMNSRAEAQFRRPARTVIGRSCFDLVCPDDRDHAREEFARCLGKGSRVTTPIRCLRGDGTIAEFDFSSAVVGGESKFMLSIVRDVTERRRTERLRTAQYGITKILSEAMTAEDGMAQVLKSLGMNLGWLTGCFWRSGEANTFRCAVSWALDPNRILDVETANRSLVLQKGDVLGKSGFSVVEKDQILGYVEYSEQDIQDPDVDQLELFVALGREIGQFLQRKAAEQERDLARERLESLVALNPAVIYSSAPDDNLTVRYMSPNVREHLGYEAGEFMRDPGLWLRGLHEDDRAGVLSRVQSLFETGMMSAEYRFRHKDGGWRWMRDEARMVRDTSGKPMEVAGYWTDVTSRHEAEQRLESILYHAPVLVFAKDLQGRYLFANRATELATGLESRKLVGRTDAELFSPETAKVVTEQDRRVLESDGPIEEEVALSLAPGARTYSLVKFPLRDAAGRPYGVCGIAADITARKRAEGDLRTSEDMFRQAQKMEAIGRLAGGVAHDFNNLLTVINGYAQMLLEPMHAEDPVKGELEQILRAGQRATGLTRQLLTFSRRQVLSPRVIDLSVILRDMEKMLRRVIGEDIELSTALDPVPGKVLADPGQIEQVVMNLVVNARDAMPGGGRLLLRTANVLLDESYAAAHPTVRPGPHTLLEICDSGTGMSEEVRRHLFEPFFTTKEKGKGTGLGLSTVYGIVKQSGGHVWVYSEIGRGTSFKIYLPQTSERISSAESAASLPGGGPAVETVLLVEDEPSVRLLAACALKKKGYKVLEASDGEEALRVASETSLSLDLVLTDVVMPRLGGLDLVKRLLKTRSGLRVVLMSGYSERALEMNGVPEGIQAILEKPFTVDGLLTVVRGALGSPLLSRGGDRIEIAVKATG